MRNLNIFLYIVATTLGLKSYPQGCSDAGFCTVGSLSNHTADDSSLISLKLNENIGLGEKNALNLETEIETKLRLTESTHLNFKIPYTFIVGDLENTNNLGDIDVSISQRILSEKEKFSIVAAMVVPSGNANIKKNGVALPMAYQTGQGTWDAIAGFSYYNEDWHLAIGYQKALTHSKNTFLHENWNNDKILEYQESNLLKRGDDVLLRVERIVASNWVFGLLPIYRLVKDEFKKNNRYIEIKGSDGLTLNANMSYRKESFKVLVAAPIMAKEIRADGLTRSFVISCTYAIPL